MFITYRFFLSIMGGVALSTATNHTNLTGPAFYIEQMGTIVPITKEWKFIAQIELSDYSHDLLFIYRIINSTKNACTLISKKIEDDICTTIVKSIEMTFDHIKKNHLIIKPFTQTNLRRTKTKRSLFGVVGLLAGSLFGVLNEKDAQYYNEQIDKLKSDDKIAQKLLKQHTTVIDATFHNVQEIQKHMIEFDSKILKITKFLEDTYNFNDYTNIFKMTHRLSELATLTTFLLNEFKGKQNTLLDLIINTKQENVHSNFIDPQELFEYLSNIVGSIPATHSLPFQLTESNIYKFFKLAQIESRIMKSKIIVKISVPLIEAQKYTLVKTTNIPAQNGKLFSFIFSEKDTLAVSENLENYFEPKLEDIKNCRTIDGIFYCRINFPIYRSDSRPTCELKAFTHNKIDKDLCQISVSLLKYDVWKQLLKPNSWVYIMPKNEPVFIDCPGKETISYILNGTGTFELDEGCTLRDKYVTLKATESMEYHVRTYYQRYEAEISDLKTSDIHETQTNTKAIMISEVETFKGIANNIEDIKTTQKLFDTVKTHKTHGMIFSSVLSSIILVIILIAWLFYTKSLNSIKKMLNTTNRFKDIEITVVQPDQEKPIEVETIDKKKMTTTYKSFSK